MGYAMLSRLHPKSPYEVCTCYKVIAIGKYIACGYVMRDIASEILPPTISIARIHRERANISDQVVQTTA